MTELPPQPLDRTIALARLAILFERVWTALLWPMLVAGAAAALVLSGLLLLAPGSVRLASLAGLAVAFLVTLLPLARVRPPTLAEAMRRVESRSALSHRPVSGLADRFDGNDPVQAAIWDEHRRRQLQAVAGAKVGAPRSSWRLIDGRALRVPVGLAVVAAALLGPGDPQANLADTLKARPVAAAPQLVVDAWLKPPAYTAKAPILLTSPAMAERLKTEPVLSVPENAVLTLRMTHATAPAVTLHEPESGAELPGPAAPSKFEGGVFQSEIALTRPVKIRVRDGISSEAEWQIAIIPDTPPTVTVTQTPAGDSSGTLSTAWKATDDYGVSGITAEVSLADEQDGGVGFEGNGIFLFDAPKVPITLKRGNAKAEDGISKTDLAEHPWAGFNVEMALTARDAANHQGTSAVVTFRMPERLFTKPLSKVLIEQRRHLILEPDNSERVNEMLDAVLTYPDGLVENSGTHIAIAMVMSRLRSAHGHDDVGAAIKMLWEIANGVEDGTMANAKAELEALRRELERALADGASPEKIAEIMDRMRQAMDRYMQSLAEEAQKRLQRGNLDQNQRMQQGRPVSPQDLQKMLDMIEKLAESGANEAAQELLSQLEDILRNMQPGMPQQGMQQGEGPLSEMLDQLSELLRRQQQLMDDTQRMRQRGEGGEPQDGSGDPQGDQSGQGLSPGDLADRQRSLGDMLQDLMRQFGQNGMESPQSFGEAGESMDGAQGSLRQGDREGALGQQGDALSKLREGAQGMAQQLLQQGQGQQGSYGRHGEARGDDRDPLGRPMPQRGEDFGPDRDMLPSELAIRRAREILDMLRSRANEPELPRIDRDYIERLLRGLY